MEGLIKRRLFIAILLPQNIKSLLRQIIGQLSQKYPQLRFEREEKLHLTLKFLGWTNVSEQKISQILEKIASEANTFKLTFSGIDFFFSFNFILFAGFKKNKDLLSLVAKIEEEMEKLGFPKERRPFKGHITLARGKGGVKSFWQNLAKKIILEKFKLSSSFLVSEIVLMESILEKEGSKYKKLKSYSFKST